MVLFCAPLVPDPKEITTAEVPTLVFCIVNSLIAALPPTEHAAAEAPDVEPSMVTLSAPLKRK